MKFLRFIFFLFLIFCIFTVSVLGASVSVAPYQTYWKGLSIVLVPAEAGGLYYPTFEKIETVRDWTLAFPESDEAKYAGQKNLMLTGSYTFNYVYKGYVFKFMFKQPFKLEAGKTYVWFFRINSFQSSLNGSAQNFDEYVSSSHFESGSLSPSVNFSRNGSDYMFSFTPTENFTASSWNVYFGNNSHSNPPYSDSSTSLNSVNFSLTLSSMISYEGDIEFVPEDFKQLQEINDKLDGVQSGVNDIVDGIYNNPYGQVTGFPQDNPADLVNQDQAIAGANGILNRAELALNGVPPGTGSFWQNLVETLFGYAIFAPFVVAAIGFILTRVLMAR